MQHMTPSSQGFIATRTGKEGRVMKYLLTPLLTVALCGTGSPALAAKKAVDGAAENPTQRPPTASAFAQDGPGLSKEERKARRDRLRAYFAKRRARRQIVDTTVTDSGQVLDWIRPESQVRGGRLASPPPEIAGDSEAEPKGLPIPFELEVQPHARGPKGTVPVVRRDVDAVINKVRPPERIEDFLSKYGRADDQAGPGMEFPDPGPSAHVYVSNTQYVEYFGTEGYINAWNPYVYKSSEFSLGQVALIAGQQGTDSFQTIEAGWQDFPGLYGDYYPHFFIFYRTGQTARGDNMGGYNQDVDGWVQYSSTYFPGARSTPTSIINGAQYTMYIRVQLYNGNWWIRCNNQWVGYYPASLFATDGLRNKATRLDWYGEIVDFDDGVPTYTDMGSGRHASEGWGKAAYMRNLRYYDLATGYSKQYDPDWTNETCSNFYSIDGPFVSSSSWGTHFYWGGPGRTWFNRYCNVSYGAPFYPSYPAF